MALVADNVRVGVTGAVYVAPEDTSLPNDAETPLDGAFADVGYISDEGITEAQGTETNAIMAWQDGALVRRVQTSHDLTYAFTMLETNETVLAEYYGNYAAGVIKIDGKELPRRAWVISVIDGEHAMRIVVPHGQITERGEISYVNGEPIGRQVTVTCYPDDTGVKAYVYMPDAGAGEGEGESEEIV